MGHGYIDNRMSFVSKKKKTYQYLKQQFHQTKIILTSENNILSEKLP